MTFAAKHLVVSTVGQKLHKIGASLFVFSLVLLTGCLTPAHLPQMDTAQSGWTHRQYQVVWKQNPKAPDMVCDVAEGHHTDGRAYLEVSKTPLNLASVRIINGRWWVAYGPRPRSGKGNLNEPFHHLWVAVAAGKKNLPGVIVQTNAQGTVIWKDIERGEQIEGIPLK